jgi:hypothetical protein
MLTYMLACRCSSVSMRRAEMKKSSPHSPIELVGHFSSFLHLFPGPPRFGRDEALGSIDYESPSFSPLSFDSPYSVYSLGLQKSLNKEQLRLFFRPERKIDKQARSAGRSQTQCHPILSTTSQPALPHQESLPISLTLHQKDKHLSF